MSKDFSEYQKETRQTAIYPKDKALEYLCLGLASEAGEVAGKLNKVIRDTPEEFPKKDMISELGDVLWYLARIADERDVDLSNVAQGNINKLRDRKNKGTIKGSGDNR